MSPSRPRDRSPPLLGTDAASNEESRAFLQTRLTLLYGALFAVFAFALVTSIPDALTTKAQPSNAMGARAPLVPFSFVSIAFGTFWLVCWRGRWSLRALHVLDVVGAIAAAAGLAWACAYLPDVLDVFVSLALSLTYLLLGRAAVVPSQGRWTLLIGAFATVAAGLTCAWLGFGEVPSRSPLHAWGAGFWMGVKPVGISAVVAAFTSRVIYGLHQQVKDARRLGQYVLEKRIGRGGMGIVYRGRHALLRRDTAVKLLQPDRWSPAALERFEREVKLTAGLTHPNTVAIFDYGRTAGGVFYYAMEYLDGGDLEDLVSLDGPLPAGRVVHVLEQVCRALKEAHTAGLIHRDIKPANILLCERGGEGDVAKVVDFGLVKEVASRGEPAHGDGSFLGTPLYVAPEAIASPDAVDARSDLYALGAVGYFLLVGAPPFRGQSAVEICAHHLHSAPLAPSRRGACVSGDLEALLLRCLEKEPLRRPQSAEELRALLLACGDVPPWSDEDAARWWDEHGARLRAHRDARREGEGGATSSAPGPLTLVGRPAS